MKTLQDKFTEVRLLLTEIEDQMEKDYQRFIDLQQLKFEFNEHEKFNKEL
jgi:5-bromo-4-chloroindolyl phosphate hydrolysis protein